jgi:hypothetical protein
MDKWKGEMKSKRRQVECKLRKREEKTREGKNKREARGKGRRMIGYPSQPRAAKY